MIMMGFTDSAVEASRGSHSLTLVIRLLHSDLLLSSELFLI